MTQTMQEEFGIGGSKITLHAGSITESRAEVLVSSDDTELSMGGGVSEALRTAAGESLLRDAKKIERARPGDVIVTSAGALSARYIFHAVTFDWQEPNVPRDAVVRRAVRKAMEL